MAKIVLHMNPVEKRKALEAVFDEWVNFTDAGRLYLRQNAERKEEKPMNEPKNGFTAKPCIFNGASGYILRQYVNGALRGEQFIHDLPEWCKAAGIPFESIQIIEG